MKPKQMIQNWVDGQGAAFYPYLYDDEGRQESIGPYGIAHYELQDGYFKWFELGGTQGNHIHLTPMAKMVAIHNLGVELYDGQGRLTAYIAPLVEAFENDQLEYMQGLQTATIKGKQDKENMKQFLSFFKGM